MRYILCLLLALMGTPVAADEVRLSTGRDGVLSNERRPLAFEVEYRWGQAAGGPRPFVGFTMASDQSTMGFVGLGLDLRLGGGLTLTPSLAAGLYRAGVSYDLGFPLEFRSGLELSYRLPDGAALSVGFHHVSNASLGRANPGTEALRVGYTVRVP